MEESNTILVARRQNLSHASSPRRETGTHNQEMSSVASAKLSAQLFDLLVE